MVYASGATNDSGGRAAADINVYEQSYNGNTNTSVIYWRASVYDNNGSLGGYAYADGSWQAVAAGGQRAAASGQSYDFGSGVIGSPYFPRAESGTFTLSHDTNGALSFGGNYVWFSGSSPVGATGTIDAGTLVCHTFVGPSTPGKPSFTRNSPYTGISVQSGGASQNDATLTRYEYDYNTDNATWGSNITSMGSSGNTTPSTITGLTSTQPYYFRTRAVTNANVNWGYGSWSASTLVPGVPSAPAITSAIVTGLSATVKCSPSATNGGATISGYFIQYRTSTNGGSTWSSWSSEDAMSAGTGSDAGSYVYTNSSLTPGTTYQFQVYSKNSYSVSTANGTSTFAGVSAPSVSSNLFVAAYGQRFDTSLTPAPGQYTRILNGYRYDPTATPPWVAIGTAQKYVSGTGWTSFQ